MRPPFWRPYLGSLLPSEQNLSLSLAHRPTQTASPILLASFLPYTCLPWCTFQFLNLAKLTHAYGSLNRLIPQSRMPSVSLAPYPATYQLCLFACSEKPSFFPSPFPVSRTNCSSLSGLPWSLSPHFTILQYFYVYMSTAHYDSTNSLKAGIESYWSIFSHHKAWCWAQVHHWCLLVDWLID